MCVIVWPSTIFATLLITPSPQCTVALNTQPEVSPLTENVTVSTLSGIHWTSRGQGVCAWVCHGNPAIQARKINVGRNQRACMIHLCCSTATRRRDTVPLLSLSFVGSSLQTDITVGIIFV